MTDEANAGFTATQATGLGFVPPEACLEGIAAGRALLEQHARLLTGFMRDGPEDHAPAGAADR